MSATHHVDMLDEFDTLVKKGMPEEQAKAVVRSLHSALQGVATKEDLSDLKKDLSKDLDNLEARIENKIDSKFNILITLGGGMFMISTLPIVEHLKNSNPLILSYLVAFIVVMFVIHSFFKGRK